MKVILFILLAPVYCLAQSPSVTPEERQKASNFYLAADWPNAITAYKKISEAEPQNWNARTRLGASLIMAGRPADAIVPLENAVKTGNNSQSMYHLAEAFAATGQPDKAFQWLDEAVKYRFSQLTVFDEDRAFSTLKLDPRYSKIRESMLRLVYPCRYAEKARDFDFWIGEWEVKNVQGATAGRSKIEAMLGDCVILENWTSALPNLYAGKSFNLYNATTKKWMQTWVDDKGGVIEFINGEYNNNMMIFVTQPDLQNQITRLTFYNLEPDHVRQLFETTTDGKTWTTTTDLHYYRVK